MINKQWLNIALIIILFFLIYYRVIFAKYAYLDEIHQLWNNQDQSNFLLFATQGRWLTGILFQKLFNSINSIEALKYLRLLSFAGWIATAIIWYFLFKRWISTLNIDSRLLPLSAIYLICCLPVAIFIGWASCLELFLGISLGLLSGSIIFNSLIRNKERIEISNMSIIGSLALGCGSLFLYQSAFGVFLLPFLVYYLQKKTTKIDRVVKIGIIFYLLIYVVYYLLFKYSLQAQHIAASERTAISFNIIDKLSFFFAGPLPSSFSLNYIYETGHILPQVIAPLIMILWVGSVFLRFQQRGFINNSLHIAFILFLLALTYIPSLIAKENFASYRTLFPFCMAVFLLLTHQLFYFIKTEKNKNIVSVIYAISIIILGFYNFNFQFLNPQKKEYEAFDTWFRKHYNNTINTVHLIRAEKKLFESVYNIRSAKDEFGAPSTSRDWVPEPLVKQTIYELTGDRKIADQIKIIQYEDPDSFKKAQIAARPGIMILDMNEFIKKHQ